MTLRLPGPPLEDPNAQEKFDTIAREWPGAGEFLRLAVAGNRKVAFGNQSFTWGGASSTTQTVTHGLGTAPTLVLITHSNNNSNSVFQAFTLTSTTFTIRAVAVVGTPANGTADSAFWLAIG